MKKLLLTVSVFLLAFSVNAQWNMDTLVRNVICNAPGNQSNPQICSDGNEGAIICWTDLGFSPPRIFAQHIDSSGFTTWSNNGILVNDTADLINGLDVPALASDGNGGAIITYAVQSGGNNQLYSIRINELGQTVWQQPVAIDSAGDAHNPQARRDNFGGAIISWSRIVGGFSQIFVQWIDSVGNSYLSPNGLQVSSGNYNHNCRIDNAGGHKAFIVYDNSNELFIQYFDTSGLFLWANPVLLTSTLTTSIPEFEMVHANGYELVFWKDSRPASQPGIYGQRITTVGNVDWTANGKVIDTSNVDHSNLDICRDGQNGAYIAFGNSTIALQRINALGNTKFSFALAQCGIGTIIQNYPKVIFDDFGGCIIAWQDSRGANGVYAQNIDSVGNILWRSCGSPVYNSSNNGAPNDMKIVSRHDQKAITTFTNNGSGSQDIIASLIYNIPEITGVSENYNNDGMFLSPNPAGNLTTISFNGLINTTNISIYNSTGQLVYNTNSKLSSITISTETWAHGLYFVKADNGKEVMNRKLIVE